MQSVDKEELILAGEDDIQDIMEIERGEGFARFVGRNNEAEHLALMRNPENQYLLSKNAEGEVQGFALVAGIGSANGVVLLKRIAIRAPGKGQGRQFLLQLIEYVFADPCHFRFWLDVLEHNERARRAYRAAGFLEEGVMRESYVMPDGQRANLVIMSVLRTDWLTAFI